MSELVRLYYVQVLDDSPSSNPAKLPNVLHEKVFTPITGDSPQDRNILCLVRAEIYAEQMRQDYPDKFVRCGFRWQRGDEP